MVVDGDRERAVHIGRDIDIEEETVFGTTSVTEEGTWSHISIYVLITDRGVKHELSGSRPRGWGSRVLPTRGSSVSHTQEVQGLILNEALSVSSSESNGVGKGSN
jgi:hypothetical protein